MLGGGSGSAYATRLQRMMARGQRARRCRFMPIHRCIGWGLVLAVRGILTVLPPGDADSGATIRGGWRGQLDEDPQDELLLCGTDLGGGWFTVVHLTAEGSCRRRNSEQSAVGLRAASVLSTVCKPAKSAISTTMVSTIWVIAPKVNGYPSAVIHRGIAGDQRFAGEGQRLSWIDPSLRNRQIRGLQLERGPAAVVACWSGSSGALRLGRAADDESSGGQFSPAGSEAVQAFDLPVPVVANSLPDGLVVSNQVGRPSRAREESQRFVRVDLEGRAVAISPNEQRIVTGDRWGNLIIWNRQGDRLFETYLKHLDAGYPHRFSPRWRALLDRRRQHRSAGLDKRR